MTSDTPISQTKKFIATALGIITLLCAVFFHLSFGLVIWQAVAGVYPGAGFVFIVLLITLPPAILCTVISLILVGPRRCKLAWISLCTFALPFAIAIGVALFVPGTKPH
jgi:hypothetical protein